MLSHLRQNHSFLLVLQYLSSERPFETLTLKFSLNPITTQKIIGKFQNTGTGLWIIVSSMSYITYHQSDNLKPLQWNSYLTPLPLKRWPIRKMLIDASKSSLSPSLTKEVQFPKYSQTRINHRFPLSLRSLSSERHFKALAVKSSLNLVTAQKMSNLQNVVRSIQIIALRESYIFLTLDWHFGAFTGEMLT